MPNKFLAVFTLALLLRVAVATTQAEAPQQTSAYPPIPIQTASAQLDTDSTQVLELATLDDLSLDGASAQQSSGFPQSMIGRSADDGVTVLKPQSTPNARGIVEALNETQELSENFEAGINAKFGVRNQGSYTWGRPATPVP